MRIDPELVNEFSKRYKETQKKCKEISQKFNEFQNDMSVIQNLIVSRIRPEPAKKSLLYFRFLQSTIDCLDLPILLVAGSYKQAIQTIRYHFESLVQAFYLDWKHPNLSREAKIAILTEIFDNPDYFVGRLLEKLKVGAKGSLKSFYKELNSLVHPSYTDFPEVDEMLKELTSSESRIKLERFGKVVEEFQKFCELSLYLLFYEFSDLKETARKDDSVTKTVESLDLSVLKSILC